MTSYARTIGPRIETEIDRLKDRRLLDGAMATSALVALADRRLAIEESLTVHAVLSNAELLKIYDPKLALQIYTGYIDKLRGDHEAGKREALEAIAHCGEDIEAIKLIIQVGIAIAKADSNFTADELEILEEICLRVGVSGLDTLGLAGMRTDQHH
jgi:tellurite resistance protein